MVNYYTYGEIPDSSGMIYENYGNGLDFGYAPEPFDYSPLYAMPMPESVPVSPLSQVGDELIPQAPPEDPMRGVSGPEMFRWSDGTYHFRPEESGQRTPIDQLPDYYRRLTEEALAKSPLQDIPDYMRQNLVGPSRTPPEMPEELIPTPRGENVPISPLISLPSGPDPISDSWGYRGENVPVSPLESLPGPGLAGDEPVYSPRGEDVPVTPLPSTIDFIRSQLGEQPQAPSSPLTDTAAVAPSMGDWTTLSEQATTEFINSLSPEDRQALFDADMAGMARGSPLKESPLALNFSGAGFGGTYSLSPQALFTEGTGGADLETGSLYAPLSSPSIERGKELQRQRDAFVTSKAGEMPGAADLKKAAEAMQAQAKSEIAAEEEKYLATLPQRRELSSLLKQNKFSEAFKYAADNGVTELITNPAELKNLRGSFTKDELGKFFSSMPDDLKPLFAPPGLQDEKFNFDPQKGVEYSVGQWRGETGFPLVSSAFMAKKDKTVENLAKVAGLAMLTAGFAPGLLGGAPAGGATAGGAAGAGTAGAGTAGAAGGTGALSGLKSAYQTVAAIPGKIGGTFAKALGLPIESTIAKTAFGNSLISGATTAAKGGDIGDIIKSGLIAAGVTYGLDAAVNAVKGMMPDISNAVGNEVSNAAAASNVPTSSALDALQEVVITAKKVSDFAGLGGAATGAATAPSPKKSPLEEAAKPEDLEEVTVTGKRVVTPPIVTKPPLQEVGKIETTKPEPKFEPAPTVDDLQEIEVTGKRVPLPPVAISPPVAPPSPIETPFEPAPTVDDLQEIEVTGKRVPIPPIAITPPPSPIETPFEPAPTVDDLQEIEVTGKRVPVPPIVVTPPPAPLETPFEPAPTVDDLQEIKVTGKRVELPPLAITQPTGPIDTAFEPAPTVDDLQEIEVTGKRTKPYIPEPPPIVISPSDILKDYKPTQVPEDSTLKNLLEKYGTLENFLKLLGSLGAGAAKGPKMPTGGLPTGGGMGGALPKYTYSRQQLSPDIDYYTYGTRPEARFFEQGLKLEQP